MYLKLICILLLAFPPLHAYTDPGSGIMLWQILLAGVAGGMFYCRQILKKIQTFFTKNKEENK